MKVKHKLFFLASAKSIHTFNWLEILSINTDYDIFLFTAHSIKFNFSKNIKIIKLPFAAPFGYFLNYFILKKYLIKESPNILHAFYATGYGFLGMLCNYKTFIVSIWGSDVLVFPNKSFLHKLILKLILNRANFICSTSNCMINEVSNLRILKPKIYHIPFAVDTNLFKKINIDNIKKRPFIIGTVKSLEIVYGIDIMIIAFAKILLKTELTINLIIYGEGKEEFYLKNLVNKLNINEFVFFKGFIPNEEVPKVLNTFDIFFALSRSESFGVSVLEALSCEIPVICSRALGFLEIINNNYNGILVNNQNIDEIVNNFLFLIENKDIRHKLGINGRNYVLENFSKNIYKDNIIKFYNDVI